MITVIPMVISAGLESKDSSGSFDRRSPCRELRGKSSSKEHRYSSQFPVAFPEQVTDKAHGKEGNESSTGLL